MKITDANFDHLAFSAYNNYKCEGISDISADMDRFKYISKAITKYKKDGEIKERLVLNHIIILFNVFGESARDFIFFKIKKDHHPVIITFMAYLHRLPDFVEINGKIVDVTKMKYDAYVAERLQQI